MKVIYSIEYSKEEKKEGYHDITVTFDNVSCDVRHSELALMFYGFLGAVGYRIPNEIIDNLIE